MILIGLMAKLVKHLRPLTEYTKALGKSLATIKRWSAAGAPLDNRRALDAWLEANGKPPLAVAAAAKSEAPGKGPGRPPKVEVESTPCAWTPPAAPKGEVASGEELGSPAALRRLQQEEAKLKQHLDLASDRMDTIRDDLADRLEKLSAIEETDPSYADQSAQVAKRQKQLEEAEINYALWSKTAREQWIKTAEQMRKYEQIVDESKRQRGEVVPRDQAEMALTMAAHWLRISIVKYLQGHGSKLRGQTSESKIRSMILDGVSSSLEAQLRNAKKVSAAMTDWQIDAVKKGFKGE